MRREYPPRCIFFVVDAHHHLSVARMRDGAHLITLRLAHTTSWRSRSLEHEKDGHCLTHPSLACKADPLCHVSVNFSLMKHNTTSIMSGLTALIKYGNGDNRAGARMLFFSISVLTTAMTGDERSGGRG